MSNQNRAFLYAGLTVVLWSTVATALKIALGGMRPTQLILIAMLTAIAVHGGILLICQRKKCAVPLLSDNATAMGGHAASTSAPLCAPAGMDANEQPGKEARTILCAGDLRNILLQGCILFAYYTLLLNAFDGLPAQVAQPINSTWALVLALLSAWFLRQKLSIREFLCMLTAYAGVVIVAVGGGSGDLGPIRPASLACVMGSTILNAAYWLLNAKGKAPQVMTLLLSFCAAAMLAGVVLTVSSLWPQAPAAAESGPFAPMSEAGGAGIPWSSLGAAVVVGLFELAIPFLLWSRALKLSTSVARVSTLSFLVPFLSLFWVSLILREPIAISTMVGLTFIVGGTFLQQQAANRRLARQTSSGIANADKSQADEKTGLRPVPRQGR